MPDFLTNLSAQPETLSLIAGIALVVAGRFMVRSALALASSVLCLAIVLGAATLAVSVFKLAPAVGWIVLGVSALIGVVAGLWIARMAERTAFAIIGAAAGGWLAVNAVLLLRANHVVWIQAPFDYAVAVPVLAVLGGGLFLWGRRWLLGATTVVLGTLLIMNALHWPWHGLPAAAILIAGLWWQNGGRRRGARSRSRQRPQASDDVDAE